MDRIVISLNPVGAKANLKLERAHVDVPGRGVTGEFDLPAVLDGDAMVRGKSLMELLLSHQPISAALTAALATPVAGVPVPLYFHDDTDRTEALPWEQLYADGRGFCTLDRRWPVGRIGGGDRDLPPRAYDPPLTIVALLSAARRAGIDQLETLITAVESAAAHNLDVRLHVLYGERAVRDRLDSAAAQQLAVTGEPVGSNAEAVCRQVAAAKPQVLHVFCHGGVVAGVRHLSVATLADHIAHNATGSVGVKAPDLARAVLPSDPWLIVLAACDTAAASDGPALAKELVNAGIPAVIGMRRPVALGETNAFCAALYPEIVATLRSAVEVPDDTMSMVDWAPALTAPRNVVTGPDPIAKETWSDPVLYVHVDRLQVLRARRAGDSSTFAFLQGLLDELVRTRARLDAHAPPELVAEFDARIAELRARLAPGDR